MDPEAQKELIELRNRMQAATPGGGTGALDPNDPEAAAAQAELDALRADKTAKASAGEGFADQLVEAGRATGQGFAAIPDALMAGAAGVANIPRRMGPNADKLLTAPTPATDWYRKQYPPNPNFPQTENVMSIAGPIAVTSVLGAIPGLIRGGLAALPSVGEAVTGLTGGAIRTGVTTGGVIGGAEVGKGIGPPIDKALGTGTLATDYLPLIGSIIGGGVAPAAVEGTAYPVLNRWLTDAGSRARQVSANLSRVPAGLDLIGNKLAAVIADASVGVPFAGGPAYRSRANQYGAMTAAADRVAALQRTGVEDPIGPRIPIDEASIGGRGIDVAQGAREHVQEGINYQYDDPQVGLHAPGRLPRDTVYRPDIQRAELDRLNADATQSTQGRTLRTAGRRIDQDTTRVIDPALEAQLEADLIAEMGSANPNPMVIDRIRSQMAANRGMTIQDTRRQRDAGVRTDTGVQLDAEMQRDIREAHTEAMRAQAEAHGIPRDEWDAREAEASRLITQRGILDPLAGDPTGRRPPEGQVYNKLTGPGENDLSLLAALNEHNPQGTQQVLADIFEHGVRGQRAAGSLEHIPETMRPAQGANMWANMPEALKSLYGRVPRVRELMQALADVLDADTRRPTRTVPGAGGNTMGAPATLFQNPTFLAAVSAILSGGGGIGGGMLGGIPGAVLGAMTPTLIARFLASRLTDPAFGARVVNPPGLAEVFGPATVGRMVQSAATAPQANPPPKKKASR